MPKHDQTLSILEEAILEFGSPDKVVTPKLDMDVCLSIVHNTVGTTAGPALYKAVHDIYGSGYVIQGETAVALLLEAVKHIAIAIMEISPEYARPNRTKFYQERMAYVSTAHITDTDSENLAKMSWKDGEAVSSKKLHVIPTEGGYFIHLNGLSADWVHEELSEDMSLDFRRLVVFAINCKIDWLHLDADGETVEGLPTHNW